jgi:hypothetical protein
MMHGTMNLKNDTNKNLRASEEDLYIGRPTIPRL